MALDPKNWHAWSVLGLNQMRLGQVAEGRKSLETSFGGDPYNVWVKNTLDLLDTYKNYDLIPSEHFQFMIEKDESAILSVYVKELAEQWWETHAGELSPSTRIGYRQWLDKRVLPKFGRKRISSVTTAEIERWYAELRDGPKPLGARSIRCCRTVLSAMFAAAVRWGYLPSSPVGLARVPKAPKWAPRSPEPEHVATRVAAAEARDPDLGVFARMAVALGARRGELAALRWTDIDLERGGVNISASVVPKDDNGTGIRRGKQLAIKDTKTHSDRNIALDQGTVNALRDMRLRHVARALECGVSYPHDAFLWSAGPDGATPRPPDRFSYDWAMIDKDIESGSATSDDAAEFLPKRKKK